MAISYGTKEKPLKLKTPPGTSEFEMYKDEKDGKEILVCTVGKTILHYNFRCLSDLHAMLKCEHRGQIGLSKKAALEEDPTETLCAPAELLLDRCDHKVRRRQLVIHQQLT